MSDAALKGELLSAARMDGPQIHSFDRWRIESEHSLAKDQNNIV